MSPWAFPLVPASCHATNFSLVRLKVHDLFVLPLLHAIEFLESSCASCRRICHILVGRIQLMFFAHDSFRLANLVRNSESVNLDRVRVSSESSHICHDFHCPY